MNFNNIEIEYGHLSLGELPPAVRARVESNPALLARWQANADLQALLRAADAGPPDPGFEDRLVFKVRTRLEQPARIPEPLDVPSGFSFPGLRLLGLAACAAIAALGAYRLWMPSPGAAPAPLARQPAAEAPSTISLPDSVLAGALSGSDASAVSNGVPRIDLHRNSIDGSGGVVPVFNPRP